MSRLMYCLSCYNVFRCMYSCRHPAYTVCFCSECVKKYVEAESSYAYKTVDDYRSYLVECKDLPEELKTRLMQLYVTDKLSC